MGRRGLGDRAQADTPPWWHYSSQRVGAVGQTEGQGSEPVEGRRTNTRTQSEGSRPDPPQ